MTLMTVTVFRQDPTTEEQPRYIPYTVEVNEGARVLHLLHAIHDQVDPTLSYRYCCSSGQCGSCAVRVNGKPVLACTAEARDGITIEPLALPLKKDLVVDLVPLLADVPPLVPGPDSVMVTKRAVDAIRPLSTCIGCLACVSICPAMMVTDFLGPTVMRQEMRLALDSRDTCDRATRAVQEGLFTCTSCQACWEVCPKDIRIPGKAIEKLRSLANKQGLTLPRHQEVAELVRATGRSVTRTGPTFLEQVPDQIEPYGPVRATIGFFVGCMYDMRLPGTALDAMEVLKRNGIRVIIPREQVCCGSPLFRTGQGKYLAMLVRRNIDAFRFRKIDIVMTMCAGCGSTIKNDYLHVPFKVMDINEVLTHFGIEPPAKLSRTVTYHDPCHLLRGQGISEEPRALIRQVADLVEMPSQCCGSGGGVKSGNPAEADALGEMRRAAIEVTGAGAVISSCPFCELHIGQHTDKSVMNIATLLLEGYREKDRQEQAEVHPPA